MESQSPCAGYITDVGCLAWNSHISTVDLHHGIGYLAFSGKNLLLCGQGISGG